MWRVALWRKGPIRLVPIINYPQYVLCTEEGFRGISWAKFRGSVVFWGLAMMWVPWGGLVVVGTMCACGPAQVLVPHHLLQGPPPSAVCYLVRFKFATFHPDEDYLGLRAPVPANTDLIAVWSWQTLNRGPIYDPRMDEWYFRPGVGGKNFQVFSPKREGRGWGAMGGSPCPALSSNLKRTSPPLILNTYLLYRLPSTSGYIEDIFCLNYTAATFPIFSSSEKCWWGNVVNFGTSLCLTLNIWEDGKAEPNMSVTTNGWELVLTQNSHFITF